MCRALTQSPIDGHPGSFHVCAAVNDPAGSVAEHAFLPDAASFPSVYSEKWGVGRSIVNLRGVFRGGCSSSQPRQ